MFINLHIPVNEYGQIATLAAVANMPLDKYVVEKLDGDLDAQKALEEARKTLSSPSDK